MRRGVVFSPGVVEDGEVDRRVGVCAEATVLVIAAGGDRVLDAVAWDAGLVIGVDRNPAQLRLTALKVAAAGSLPSAGEGGERGRGGEGGGGAGRGGRWEEGGGR